MANYSLKEIPCTICRNPKHILQEVSRVFSVGALGDFTGYAWTPVRKRPASLTMHTISTGEVKENLAVTMTLVLSGTSYLLSIRFISERVFTSQIMEDVRSAIRKAGSQVLDKHTTTILEDGSRVHD